MDVGYAVSYLDGSVDVWNGRGIWMTVSKMDIK